MALVALFIMMMLLRLTMPWTRLDCPTNLFNAFGFAFKLMFFTWMKSEKVTSEKADLQNMSGRKKIVGESGGTLDKFWKTGNFDEA